MPETAQILLIIVVATLTILLAVVGVQAFFILKELRRSIEKMNKILDDVGTVSESVARPISSLSNSITGLSGITGLLGWLVSRKKIKEKQGEEND